jgi:hypothetical protein
VELRRSFSRVRGGTGKVAPFEALTTPALLSQRERREKNFAPCRGLFLFPLLAPWERRGRGGEGFGATTTD